MNSSATGTGSVQGVRQLAPSDVRASAPGGSDSIDRLAIVGLDENRSKLGIHDVFHDEQAASPRLHATTAMNRVMFMSVPWRSRMPLPVGCRVRRDSISKARLPRADGAGAAGLTPKSLAQRTYFCIQ